MMHEDRLRAGSFGADAEQYDRTRPSYPASLVEDLMSEAPRTVLDVGCGTGIAAQLLADRGCEVLGVEPDPRMAALAQARGIRVEHARFEEWDPAGRAFDLLTCGQAWHWVDPALGPTRAAAALRPGGRAGLFWNQGRLGPELRAAFEEVYRRRAPGLDRQSILLRNLGRERFEHTAASFTGAGLFARVEVRSYLWERTYTREEWLDHLPTHSDHRVLPPDQRAALLAEIGDVIDRLGGSFLMPYQAWLISAWTPVG